MTPQPSCHSEERNMLEEGLESNQTKVYHCVSLSLSKLASYIPKKKITKAEEVKRYLDEALGVSGADVVWRFVVLRSDSQHSEEYC